MSRTVSTPEGTLPDYADHGSGFPVFRGPYFQKDARLAAFIFKGDTERLTAHCNQALNVSPASKYKYVPLTSSLMLVFADMLVSSRDERDKQVGLIPETEVSFWVLTVAMLKTPGGYIPHHLAWFLPYLFVDGGDAIATGREVYGFNKLAAQFQKPQQIRKPEFRADVVGFKEFGPDSIAQREPLLVLSAPSPVDAAPSSNLESIKNKFTAELFKNIQTGLGADLLAFAARFVNDHIPLVFLKQFRDAQDTHKACYQKVIEVSLKVEAFYEGGIFPEAYTLHIAHLASHPLAQSLGLKAGEQKSMLGTWLRVDFGLGNKVLQLDNEIT